MSSTSRLNAVQASHTQIHHRSPIFAISHSTSVMSGMPSAADISVCLTRSIRNSLTVNRLKPKRASTTKVRYTVSGSSSSESSSTTETMSRTPCAMLYSENAGGATRVQASESHCRTPPKVRASTRATEMQTSTIASRVLTTV